MRTTLEQFQEELEIARFIHVRNLKTLRRLSRVHPKPSLSVKKEMYQLAMEIPDSRRKMQSAYHLVQAAKTKGFQ